MSQDDVRRFLAMEKAVQELLARVKALEERKTLNMPKGEKRG